MRTKKELLNELSDSNAENNSVRKTINKKDEIYLEVLIDIRDLLEDISVNITGEDISNFLRK